MRAECVGLGDHAPVRVDRGGAFVARAYAFFPVVIVCKASARPAKDGDIELFQCVDDVFANAAYVGNGRIFAHPEAFVDAAAQVFGEVTVDLRGDSVLALIDVNDQAIDTVFLGRDFCCADRYRSGQNKQAQTELNFEIP